MEEFLTVYEEKDGQLHEIGVMPRKQVHKTGQLHKVVHCWILSWDSAVSSGNPEMKRDALKIWFQQRASDKADFPDYYDIAVGGHIDPGESPLKAILRETREESGLSLTETDLQYLGAFRDGDFHMGDFFDREVAEVYLYMDLIHPVPPFFPGDEVSRMISVSFSEYCRKELNQAEQITAYTTKGLPIMLSSEQWLRHPGEFETALLPYLKKKGLVLDESNGTSKDTDLEE